jgi:predicted secreted protein
MAYNGNNILVYRGTTIVGGTKSNEIQTNVELMEVASPSTGQWRAFIAGRKDCTLTIGYLVLSSSLLGESTSGVRDLLQVGSAYTLKFKERAAADSAGVSGLFLLKTCRITSIRGNLVQGSFQFQLNGALT